MKSRRLSYRLARELSPENLVIVLFQTFFETVHCTVYSVHTPDYDNHFRLPNNAACLTNFKLFGELL